MTNKSAVLQKKLHELESELTTRDPRREIDIKHRFTFLDTLLKAEVASQPQDSDQLHEIGERLTALRSAFRDSNASSNDLDDTLLKYCDCTESLQNDDVQESESRDSITNSGENSSDDQFSDCVGGDEKKEERIWVRIVKYSGVFGCGMIFGAFCMMKFLNYSSHHFVLYHVSLLHPT